MHHDLIIVGAGSAGCVIARRATENTRRSVLLLEAGPDYPELAALPRDLTDGRRNSMNAHDWGYRHRPTTTQPLVFRFPRGRVVGGSSAVNTCIALRGQPEDYDEWNATLPGWSWTECLPAFKAIERDLDMRDDFHGHDGPLPIRRHPRQEWVAWQAAFVEGCLELGYPSCDDSNRPGSHGVGPHAMNKLEGRRVSAAQAFLTPDVRQRDNFTLRPNTLVRRILFRNRRVTGVEVEGPTGVETLSGSHVVLCAGAINTPSILLRSGVGPVNDVARLGCEAIAHVPGVGRRLLDHPGTAIVLRPRWGAGMRRRDPLIQTVLRYASSTEHPSDMLLQPGSSLPLPGFDLPLLLLMCSVGKPRGVGRLHFTSADTCARPVIESQFLADGTDRNRAVTAMELAYALMQTAPLRALAKCLWPSARVLRRRDRIRDWIGRGCDSGYHPCGTAPMGPSSDANAVTDTRGRVYAVEGLSIADASLMPSIPSSNIHLPVLMIGERIGSRLRDELD